MFSYFFPFFRSSDSSSSAPVSLSERSHHVLGYLPYESSKKVRFNLPPKTYHIPNFLFDIQEDKIEEVEDLNRAILDLKSRMECQLHCPQPPTNIETHFAETELLDQAVDNSPSPIDMMCDMELVRQEDHQWRRSHDNPESHFHHHPTYLSMIMDAIKDLNDSKGASKAAILKYIAQHYELGENLPKINTYVRSALKHGMDHGDLKQTRGHGASGSFQISSKGPHAQPAENKQAAKPEAPAPKTKRGRKSGRKGKKAQKPDTKVAKVVLKKKSAQKAVSAKKEDPKKQSTTKRGKTGKPEKGVTKLNRTLRTGLKMKRPKNATRA